MRKLCLIGLILGLLAPGLALAAPMGLTGKQLQQGQFAMGLTGSYVFESQFANADLERSTNSGAADVERVKGKFKDDQRYMLQFAYGVSDRLSLYVQGGVASGGKWSLGNLTTDQSWEAKFRNSFVWALGAQAQVWKLPNGFGLDLMAQYLRFDDRKIKDWRNDSAGYDASEQWSLADKINHYWQAEILARMSWSIGRFTPFLGAGWSHAEAKYTGSWTGGGRYAGTVDYTAQMVNQDELLTTAGVEVALWRNLNLTLEGRFLAQTEAGLGLNWSF